ncbi:MAG: Uncharacterised protein [Synechococcus sp. MIT S9220]|nr:MAG: Uncharacterised protein [Synechococcus sp. MIT S9220]
MRRGVAEAAPMRLVKQRLKLMRIQIVLSGCQRERQSLFRGSVTELQPDAMLHHFRRCQGDLPQGQGCLVKVSADHGRQLLQQRRIKRTADRPLMQLTLTGLPKAIGREHTRQRMQQHLTQPQRFGQATSQLPCGTAVGNQCPSTDVMPTEQRHVADRSRHRLDSEVKSTFGQLLGSLTQLR